MPQPQVKRPTVVHLADDDLAGGNPTRLLEQEGSEIHLDLGQVRFLGSEGLRALLLLKQKIKRVILVNVPPHIHDVFVVTRLTDVFEVHPASAQPAA